MGILLGCALDEVVHVHAVKGYGRMELQLLTILTIVPS
jgi:hypothetical protein